MLLCLDCSEWKQQVLEVVIKEHINDFNLGKFTDC